MLDLPPGADEDAVVAGRAPAEVGLYGMSQYRTSSNKTVSNKTICVRNDLERDPCGRERRVTVLQPLIGFGTLPERQIREGIATIADLLRL